MKKNMKHINCIFCNNNNQKPLLIKGKEITVGQFGFPTYPVICDCGLIFLSPRHSEKWYNNFYKSEYDNFYRLETKKDYGKKGVIRNANEIIDRIKKYFKKPDIKILDIGCGSGTMLKHFGENFNTNNIYGIESSQECIQSLQSNEINGTIVSTDMNSNWVNKYYEYFDLIIMRHVLEHTFNPIEALRHIRTAIKKDGYIYISVPDMLNPRIELRDYTDWWEYWFRVVHTYYFSYDTLSQVLFEAKFKEQAHGFENEEVWMLSKNDFNIDESRRLNPILYKKQMDILNRLLP